ncbi:TPR-like protein [Ascobolus immersus RN42]|uniref:TPR-like protein n=1 Tax=Ascobolus immersus RN42 TaxID=1160509 RepID=A0A3N4I0L3_ASCIM|nr:TPR-like protein [Ascobolus immersus RN42]
MAPAMPTTTGGDNSRLARFSHVPRAIDVPLNEAQEDDEDAFVEVDFTSLPEDPTELCTLLDNENGARELWMMIATAYSKKGQTDLAIEMLNRGLNSQTIERGAEAQKMPFWGALTWMYLQKARESPRRPQGFSEPDGKYRERYLETATSTLNLASRVDQSWAPTMLARGVNVLMSANLTNEPMARGRILENAFSCFEEVFKASKSRNMYALMGKAKVSYARKRYAEALEMYQRVLRNKPNMDPDPRIGIGLCLWHLGHREQARKAWERALSLKPDSYVVKTLLGMYHLQKMNQYSPDSEEFVEHYQRAMKEYMQVAWKQHPSFPLSCLGLSSYFLNRRDYVKVERLAKKVLEYSDVPELISDAHYTLARIYHAQEDAEKAKYHYMKSDALRSEKGTGVDNSGFLPAKIGLAQLQIQGQDLSAAKVTFERILATQPKCVEALTLLGTIYANEVFTACGATGVIDIKPEIMETRKKAIHYFETIRNMWKDPTKHLEPDHNVLLNLSRLYEGDSPEKALQCMQQVEQLQKDELTRQFARQYPEATEEQIAEYVKEQVDPRILNNIAVFHYQLGNYEQARILYQQAMAALPNASSKDSTLDSDALSTSLTYNLGRLEEACGNTDEAIKLYEEVKKRHEGYVDANARFLYLAMKRSPEEASKLGSKLLDSNGNNPEVRALVGWYMGKNRRKFPSNLAQVQEDQEHRLHKHTLQHYDKHDRYALTAMGNIYLIVAREMKRETESDRDKRSRMYEKAVEFFDKALLLDPKNAYAAQGLAIALAEDKRNYSVALQIFTKLKETVKEGFIFNNLGHCLTSLDQYPRAIENYEIAIKYNGEKDHNTINCLSRVWYLKGRKEKNLALDSQKTQSIASFKQSLSLARKALELSPNQTVYQFNVAFVQFQLAQQLLALKEHQRSLEDMEQAQTDLEDAIKTFSTIAKSKHSPYPGRDIEQRAVMARNTLSKQLERDIVKQREYEHQNAEKLMEAKMKREAELRRRREAEEAARRAEEEHRLALIEQRRRMQEETLGILSKKESALIDEEDEKEEKAEKRKRAKEGKSSGGGSKGGRGKKRRKEEDSSSEEEGGRGGSDSESGREGKKNKGRKRLTKGKQFKSKETIDSDDEEMDMGAPAEKPARPTLPDSDEEEALPTPKGSDDEDDLFGDDAEPAKEKSDAPAGDAEPMDVSE